MICGSGGVGEFTLFCFPFSWTDELVMMLGV